MGTDIATPNLEVEMLAVLVSLPVVLAPETFITGSECAAVGALVSFHVFPT